MLNGLDSMKKKILDDAQSFAAENKKASDAKVDEILRDYQAQADTLEKSLVSDAQREAEGIRARAESQAALAERSDLLRAKHDVIDAAFSRACEMITQLPRDEYVSLLARLVAKYQTGKAEIILNERDMNEIGGDLIKQIVVNKIKTIDVSMVRISKTPGNFLGGLILRQGDIDTNCTLEVLCSGLRHELEPAVIKLLQF